MNEFTSIVNSRVSICTFGLYFLTKLSNPAAAVWGRIGTTSHIFPYRARGNTVPRSWTVNKIFVLLSHLSPVLRLQRLNRPTPDAYRCLLTGGGDPLPQIELNGTPLKGCIELVHPPAPLTRVISQIHGQPLIFYVMPRFKIFCQAHGLRQFQCHRHLIAWFGSIIDTIDIEDKVITHLIVLANSLTHFVMNLFQ